MVTRQKTLAAAAVYLALTLIGFAATLPAQTPAGQPTRIISLVPALTEMLFDLGAGDKVVAVSRYDTYPNAVRSLPRVGGLLDPDYEGILRLSPDFVVTYGSQTELERRLAAGGIRYYSYRHPGVAGTLRTIRELGVATNHVQGANAAADRLQARIDGVRARVRGLARPRTLVVFGRERGTLRQIYASGGGGFEHELLDAAGGVNVFASARGPSVQPSIEMLLAAAPEVIVELHGSAPPDASVIKNDHEVWGRLTTIPAVRNGRIHVLYGEYLGIPGPRMGETAEAIARAIHPEAFR